MATSLRINQSHRQSYKLVFMCNCATRIVAQMHIWPPQTIFFLLNVEFYLKEMNHLKQSMEFNSSRGERKNSNNSK